MTTKADINKLVEVDDGRGALDLAEERDSIAESIGEAVFVAGEESTSGIASPLSETGRTDVDYEIFDDFNVWSTTIKAVTILNMNDVDDREVVFKFIDPNTGLVPE